MTTRLLRLSRFLFFLAVVVLVIAWLSRAFVPGTGITQTSASTVVQFQQLPTANSSQSGQGGGTGTMLLRAGGTIYGAGGPGGTCKGTAGGIAQMLTMDFGWTTQYLNPKWAKDTKDELCNDHWFWTTTQTLPAKTVFTTLQWTNSQGQPLNLLAAPYANQPITVRPIAQIDPTTSQQQQQQQQQQDTQPHGPCDWTFPLLWGQVHIDVCAPLRLILQAGAGAVRSLYQATAKQITFLWTTPLQPFQSNASGLMTVWNTSWAIVLACITAVVAWGALRYMVGTALSWLAYANLIELLPRVLFALLAAFYSKQFFIVFIQMNNALATIFNANALTIMLNQQTGGIINSAIQILYGIMAFILILEEIARIAVIYLLFAFSPFLFFLASLRETQRFAKTAAIAAILFIFLQAMQAAALDVGGQVLTTVLHSKPGNLSFLNLLVSLTIMYITLALFFGIVRVALGRAGDPIAALPFIAAAAPARFGLGVVKQTARGVQGVDRSIQRTLQPLANSLAPATATAGSLGSQRGGQPPTNRPGGTAPNGPGGGPAGPAPTGGPGGVQVSPAAGGSPGAATPLPSPGAGRRAGTGGRALSGTWQRTPPVPLSPAGVRRLPPLRTATPQESRHAAHSARTRLAGDLLRTARARSSPPPGP